MKHNVNFDATERFLCWLEAENWTHAELIEFCATGLVSGRESDESHIQLVAALPVGGDHYRLATLLARRLAALLEAFPRLDFPFPGEEMTPIGIQYEVLALASALDCPHELSGVLQNCEVQLRSAGIVLPLSVRGALTEALTRQQLADSPLRVRWLSMARGESDPLLGDSPEVGMQGLFMIPAADAEEPGHPGVDREALGEGLLAYASVCSSNPITRRQRFRRMVERIRTLWDLKSVYFIKLAHDFKWVQNGHAWAVDALPELFVEWFGEVGSEKEHCWLVWHWFVRALEPLRIVDEKNKLCGGLIVVVNFGAEHSALCQSVSNRFQRLARGKAEISEMEAYRYVEQEIAFVAQSARHLNEIDVAHKLEATRNDFLTEKHLISGLQHA